MSALRASWRRSQLRRDLIERLWSLAIAVVVFAALDAAGVWAR
jgi:hypothetical protein